MKKVNLLMLFAFIFGMNAFSQDTYKLVEGKSKALVSGTSTLHDWRCKAEKQSGVAVINTNGTFEIKSLTAKVVTKSLKSIKENGSYYDEGMDKNAYKALNADKYPEITYTLVSISNVKTAGTTTTFTAVGNLTIAGKTNKVTFPVKAVTSGNTINLSSTFKFNLTSFGVTPPKALMGTIKTGDAVVLTLNSTFAK